MKKGNSIHSIDRRRSNHVDKLIQPDLNEMQPHKIAACNICGKSFKAHSRFERFCHTCKIEDEAYQSYEEEQFESAW